MCGRYAATKDPATLVAEFDAVDNTEGKRSGADYNVAPTKDVVSVVQRHPRDADGTVLEQQPAQRGLRVMRWGLVPFWAKDPAIGNRMINTRAESAKDKPAFRKALSRRRCLLPADGWFEWRPKPTADGPGNGKKAGKDPFFMTTPDDSSLAFAGLWESWRDPNGAEDAAPLITCSVLTIEALGQLAEIHHRMPLMMPATRWADWLDPDNTDPSAMLDEPPWELIESLELRPVSTLVNNVRNNGPELVERVEAEPEQEGALFGLPGS